MSVRAYDPTLGRFLSRDPLKRAPLVFTDQPYVYAGNNPLVNVDPSGQFVIALGGGEQSDIVIDDRNGTCNVGMCHIVSRGGQKSVTCDDCTHRITPQQILAGQDAARGIAHAASQWFQDASNFAQLATLVAGGIAVLLSRPENPALWFWSGFFWGLTVSFGLLAFEADQLKGVFSGEDTGWTAPQFTASNIMGKAQDVNNIVGAGVIADLALFLTSGALREFAELTRKGLAQIDGGMWGLTFGLYTSGELGATALDYISQQARG